MKSTLISLTTAVCIFFLASCGSDTQTASNINISSSASTVSNKADLTIASLSGYLEDNETITITGSGFGDSGPEIAIFDDFSNGIPGNEVSMNATIGSWTSTGAPIYVADNSNIAAALVDAASSPQVRIDFAPVQEFFLSYKVKIPSGFHFPNSNNPGEFAPDSAWKLAWIMDNTTGSGYDGDDDICLPSWPNGTRFDLSGNDGAFSAAVGQPGTSSKWFSFNGWNRATTYMKAGSDPVNDNGIIWFSGLSEEFGQKQFSRTDRPIFDGDDNSNDNAISQWSRINLSGWHRKNGINAANDSMTLAYYDDIYIATGPNAAARIEIGNNAQYENCTKLAIATPEDWSDMEISATIRQGEFVTDEDVYLFIIDSGNTPSASVGPFRFGSQITY